MEDDLFGGFRVDNGEGMRSRLHPARILQADSDLLFERDP